MPYRVVTIVIHRGHEETVTTEISGNLLRIGRGTDNDIHLDDLSVSYAHAIIEFINGVYILRDLSGTRRTYVNHAPVRETLVEDGDIVRIGPYSLQLTIAAAGDPLTVKIEEDPAAKTTQKVALLSKYRISANRWVRLTVSLAIPLALLIGVMLALAAGNEQFFIPGEISLKHSLFGNDCGRCHTPWQPIWSRGSDEKCSTCHSLPAHFDNRSLSPTPMCVHCHGEHSRQNDLAALPDSACVECHGELKTKQGDLSVARSIHGFTWDHPEFAISVSRSGEKAPQRVSLDDTAHLVDHSALKFNHDLHLDPELLGPDGPESLTCTSCHQSGPLGAQVLPVKYQKHCERCHLLDFDAQLANAAVPHGLQPEEIHDHLGAVYAELYVMEKEEGTQGGISTQGLEDDSGLKGKAWVNETRERAERKFFKMRRGRWRGGKCLLCHVVDPDASGPNRPELKSGDQELSFPVLARPTIRTRWLPRSEFNHAPHARLIENQGCLFCHGAAETSETSKDVLLPRKDLCRSCHFEPGGARTHCVTCHVFHGNSGPLKSGPPYRIEDITR